MRVDMLLDKLYLVKSRTQAKNAADLNLVFVNGKNAKAAAEANVGDVITYSLNGRRTEVKIIRLPQGNLPKKDAGQYYEIISSVPVSAEQL